MRSSESSQKMEIGTNDCQDKENQFLDIVNQYQDAIFRFLYFRVNNRAVAVDITQDTFTKTWIYLNSNKKIAYIEAFLYRAAKNALIDYYKKQKADSLDTFLENGYDPVAEEEFDSTNRTDDTKMIQKIMENLDEESKQIIFLRYTEEKPIEEIAKIYGKSTNAMTVKIHRIITKLRANQKEYGE